MFKKILLSIVFLVVLVGGFHYAGLKGVWGDAGDAGVIEGAALSASVVGDREGLQAAAISAIGKDPATQILFGDLHVHTTYSGDAFLFSLPMFSGEGSAPIADACDFARYCSALDFWSINDHAESTTGPRWAGTVDSIRQCNAIAGEGGTPDMVSFLGWEWSQVGQSRETHYGHKNVVLAGVEDDEIPDRPIASAVGFGGAVGPSFGMMGYWTSFDSSFLDLAAYLHDTELEGACPEGVHVRDMPPGCIDATKTPDVLYRKLREWGHRAIVIPHGTTWGLYTPQGSSWDKQLVGAMHDPNLQSLIEVHSGHGNSEEYRSWREYRRAKDGSYECPAPTEGYLPMCWQAGVIAEERCLAANEDEAVCVDVAAKAREFAASYNGPHSSRVLSGTILADWLDAGQCRDCFLPSFNYAPKSSVQYILALTNFDDPDVPRRFRFGMIGSSDIHTARPGTGYKEYGRGEMTEGAGISKQAPFWAKAGVFPSEEARRNYEVRDLRGVEPNFTSPGSGQADIAGSMLYTGGLTAVHAPARGREEIWTSLQNRNVYSTSGPRILLWFDAVDAAGRQHPMGSELEMSDSPMMAVRALGSFEQKPGCPDHVRNGLSSERIADLCKNECYNPSDTRRSITRIEVVRIMPQVTPGEAVGGLIEDPWRVFECPANGEGCKVNFSDPEFATSARDAVYYARAIEAPSMAVNGSGVRCEFDADGKCIKSNPCYSTELRTPPEDDCLGEVEERAWSSPIFVDYKRPTN